MHPNFDQLGAYHDTQEESIHRRIKIFVQSRILWKIESEKIFLHSCTRFNEFLELWVQYESIEDFLTLKYIKSNLSQLVIFIIHTTALIT